MHLVLVKAVCLLSVSYSFLLNVGIKRHFLFMISKSDKLISEFMQSLNTCVDRGLGLGMGWYNGSQSIHGCYPMYTCASDQSVKHSICLCLWPLFWPV